ncbi:MAG: GTPase domain-containing protein [Gemmataceae bacterium]
MNELSTTITTPPVFETAADDSVPHWPKAPLQVCLLGGRGAGKTCFLGGLAILDRFCGWHMRADARSTTRLDDIITTLTERGMWLAPTRDTERYHLTLSFEGLNISFDTYDYPGVYVQTAIRSLNRDAEPELLQHYLEADCLLVLLDPDEDLVDAPVLAAIDDALKHRFLGNNKKPPHVGIVLTKADRYNLQTASQATAFLREHCPTFLAKVKTLSRRTAVFPLSAVGTVDDMGRPTADGRPKGYEALFRWLISRDRARKRRPWAKWTAMTFSILVLAGALWRSSDLFAYLGARATLREQGLPVVEQLDRTRHYDGWFSKVIDADRAQLARGELARLQAAIPSAKDEATGRKILDQIAAIAVRSPDSLREELIAASQAAIDHTATVALEPVLLAKNRSDRSWGDQARLFIDRYPDTQQAIIVREWIVADMPAPAREGRIPIARIEVDGPASCQYKADAIRKYLREFGSKHSETERRRIERAAELGEMFARKREWSIQLLSAGEFKVPRPFAVRVVMQDNDFVTLDSPNPLDRVSFTEEPVSMEWRPGQPLRVQIWGDEAWLPVNRRDTHAASITLEGPFALLDLVGGDTGLWLTPDRRWRNDFTGIPIIRFRARGFDPDDARIAREYLSPGLRWK